MVITIERSVRKLVLAASVLLFLPTDVLSGERSPSGRPLLDAFKQFCVETGARPEGVRTAIEAAGGKPGNAGSTTFPFPMTTASWELTLLDHRMIVNAGSGNPKPGINFDNCGIVSYANEDASVAEIQEWAAVPPNHISTGNPFLPGSNETMYTYQFQTIGSEHTVPSSREEVEKAISESRYCTLHLTRADGYADVDISH